MADDNIHTIGFIGSGNIGATVAQLAIDAGYSVILSNSRGPETLADLVAELGSNASATTPDEVARLADLVVESVPLHAYPSLPVEALAGKTVIDTANYYPDRDGKIERLETEETTTSELVQEHLPDAQVVKAFNNIGAVGLKVLSRASGSPERTALPIAGDYSEAKATVQAFLDRIGYDTVDVGSLAEGWRFQRDTAAYVTIYGSEKGPRDPQPASAQKVQEHLDQAQRYSESTQ